MCTLECVDGDQRTSSDIYFFYQMVSLTDLELTK